MTVLHPSWRPFASPAPAVAMEEPLHLRFAITPAGPWIEHLPDGEEAEMSQQQDSARHELNLAALLVCLAVEDAEFAARAEAVGMGHPGLDPSSRAEASWIVQHITDRWPPGSIPFVELSPEMNDEWVKLLHSRSGMDAVWPLA